MDHFCYLCLALLCCVDCILQLMITCLEMTDLLAFLCVVFCCVLSLSHMVFWSGVVLDCIDS